MRILIVDDEPMISMLLEDWVEELGHEVVGPARDVASALALIGPASPDAAENWTASASRILAASLRLS